MSSTHDVISAFLDDEPFDANQLAEALSDPGGRDLLLDLLALRHLVQPQGSQAAYVPQQRGRPMLRALLATAAMLVALVGGYLVGQHRDGAALSEAPRATRVVEAPSAWQDVPPGRMR